MNKNQYSIFTSFKNRYPMYGTGDQAPFWYSFNYLLVYFISMSTEQEWSEGSKQYNWIINELIIANKLRETF